MQLHDERFDVGINMINGNNSNMVKIRIHKIQL